METKKDILIWWEERGKVTDNYDDYADFWKKINRQRIGILEKARGSTHYMKLFSPRWKKPLYLYFYDLECYEISSF